MFQNCHRFDENRPDIGVICTCFITVLYSEPSEQFSLTAVQHRVGGVEARKNAGQLGELKD